MAHAFVFPGQGAQFPGMGKDIYDSHQQAKKLFEEANDILSFRISDIMFEGQAEDLQETKVTQPAIFIHSVAAFRVLPDAHPDMVAGHSLGEFSALVANGTLSFSDGLKLVAARASAMQKACELTPSTMAAVLGLEDQVVEDICSKVDDIVVAANFNCPGQVVISGSATGVEKAELLLQEAGARRVVPLKVSGAFHSPLMEPAKIELASAIQQVHFNTPDCPVYQNVSAKAESDPEIIKENLIRQLTAPVRWTQSVLQMIADGADTFTECGPGKVLQGLIRKINREVTFL